MTTLGDGCRARRRLAQRGRPAGRRRNRERGSATVWVLAAGLLTISVATVSAASGAAVVARHRAQVAADLGALAAATRVFEGQGPACAWGGEIVTRNGARLIGCDVDGFDVVVTVSATPSGFAAAAGPARASARAGPA
jgi:secretion/DNA translocation related TadE-like protein